jgi:hypothetical protein
MATSFSKLSKWMLISGGALLVAGMIYMVSSASGNTTSVSAQASPTARPATATAAATPVRTATPAATVAPAASPTRAATAAPVTAARTATPAAAPGGLPANGDSVTFPALAVALAGAGLVGLGLFARFAMGKSKA